jgi:hypothetical protein
MLRAAAVTPPLALADFLCDFDSTGISAGRHWWVDYWDAEKNRRKMPRAVTSARTLDTILALSYAIVRQLARSGRQVLSSKARTSDSATTSS